jgi:N-acetylglutamate synthase-like GNAT family acetyltransferase
MKEKMIRQCYSADLEEIHTIINTAALAYKGVIPDDCWQEPYMPQEELQREIARGVEFWGYEEAGVLSGVMGIQLIMDVTLIRHAYIRPDRQRKGIGSLLLRALKEKAASPVLIGTWAGAIWAIHFYEKHGFIMVTKKEKDRLLRKYWTITERQVETSVVLCKDTNVY